MSSTASAGSHDSQVDDDLSFHTADKVTATKEILENFYSNGKLVTQAENR